MTKDDTSISVTYENNIFYCIKDSTKWISIDGENWYGEERRIKELEAQIEKMNGYIKELFNYYDELGCDIPTINNARKYLETGVAE